MIISLLGALTNLLTESNNEKRKHVNVHKLEKLNEKEYKYPILGGKYWVEGLNEDGFWIDQVVIKTFYAGEFYRGGYYNASEVTTALYDGAWANGVPHGYGRLSNLMYFSVLTAFYYEAKGFNEAKFQDPFFHYNTHRFWNHMDSYEGEFVNGLPHGYGKAYRMHSSKGLKIWYEGQFDNACPVNFDIETFNRPFT